MQQKPPPPHRARTVLNAIMVPVLHDEGGREKEGARFQFRERTEMRGKEGRKEGTKEDGNRKLH